MTRTAQEANFNRDFKPTDCAIKWLKDLAIYLKMKQLDGEPLWHFKNRMYASIRKR